MLLPTSETTAIFLHPADSLKLTETRLGYQLDGDFLALPAGL